MEKASVDIKNRFDKAPEEERAISCAIRGNEFHVFADVGLEYLLTQGDFENITFGRQAFGLYIDLLVKYTMPPEGKHPVSRSIDVVLPGVVGVEEVITTKCGHTFDSVKAMSSEEFRELFPIGEQTPRARVYMDDYGSALVAGNRHISSTARRVWAMAERERVHYDYPDKEDVDYTSAQLDELYNSDKLTFCGTVALMPVEHSPIKMFVHVNSEKDSIVVFQVTDVEHVTMEFTRIISEDELDEPMVDSSDPRAQGRDVVPVEVNYLHAVSFRTADDKEGTCHEYIYFAGRKGAFPLEEEGSHSRAFLENTQTRIHESFAYSVAEHYSDYRDFLDFLYKQMIYSQVTSQITTGQSDKPMLN